ncbi:MAG: phosphatidylglycerophosphatase A [bacterium]
MKNMIKVFLGTACGLGLIPIAPGTFGTLLGVLVHIAIVIFLPENTHIAALITALFLVSYANHVLTPWACKYWQSEDPGHFVLDEVAGYLIVPIFFHSGELWQIALWGFILFRIFDIIKIPPARQIDRKMKGAWGILLDDIVSAGYAVITMYFLLWIGPKVGLDAWLITP